MPEVKRRRAAKAGAPVPTPMPDRPGRWKLIWRQQRAILRRTLAGASLAAALLLVALTLHGLGAGGSIRERLGDATGRLGLRVTEVRFDGNRKTPLPLLRDALGVEPGDPTLGFSVADARTRLEAIRWIKSATVERRLSGLILVHVEERQPFALHQLDGRVTLVDRKGDPVTDSEVARFKDQVPWIVGPGAPRAAAELIDVLAAQPDILARMQAAVRIGERRWNLHMTNGTDVLLPEGAEAPALARLAQLQASHQLLDRPLQTIDLRLPDRLVIRPAAERPPAAEHPTSRKPT